MAQTIQQIYDEIVLAKEQEPLLDGFDTTSRTSIHGLWIWIMATAIWTQQKLNDIFRVEVLDIISRMKPHTLRWYVEKAKAFQFGDALPADTDQYDNTGKTADQIETSRVVKYAACTRQARSNGRIFLRLKVAGAVNSDIGPLAAPQKAAFEDYMFRVSDAGVDLQIDSLPADKIKQVWRIYYDPLILSATGARLDGQDSEPVRTAIKEFLKQLLFNGTYVPAYHIDAVQAIEGVVIPVLVECQATYGDLPYTSVSVKYEPDGGYLRFPADTDLAIEYVAQTELR